MLLSAGFAAAASGEPISVSIVGKAASKGGETSGGVHGGGSGKGCSGSQLAGTWRLAADGPVPTTSCIISVDRNGAIAPAGCTPVPAVDGTGAATLAPVTVTGQVLPNSQCQAEGTLSFAWASGGTDITVTVNANASLSKDKSQLLGVVTKAGAANGILTAISLK